MNSGFPTSPMNNPAAYLTQKYILLRDEKPSGTDGGGSSGGAWRVRTLNTIVWDDTGQVRLNASSQFYLPAGVYYTHFEAPSLRCDTIKVRLYNATDAVTILQGMNSYQGNTMWTVDWATGVGKFRIADTKLIELHQWVATSIGGNGLGVSASFPNVKEIYSFVELWQLPE